VSVPEIKSARQLGEVLNELKALIRPEGVDRVFDILSGVIAFTEDRHAHELAEKIRNSEELRDFTDDHMSDCNAAADFIDPEVSGV
jgi:hypothetical protein